MKNSEKQDQDTDLLMKEVDEEITEDDLIGNVEDNILGLTNQD